MARKKTVAAEPTTKKPDPDDVVGRTIVEARPMRKAELDVEGWEDDRHGPPVVLVLDNGAKLYPSRDDEGNGPGAMFGTNKQGKAFRLA